MRWEFTQDLEAADADCLVYVYVTTSCCKPEDAPRDLFTWFARYQPEHYQFVGMIDIVSGRPTEYRWAEGGGALRPHSTAWLAVLQNKRLGIARPGRAPDS